jgi:predicted MFS family arabinose efflux permease
VSPPTTGRFSLSNRILRPINRLRYARQPSCIDRASTVGLAGLGISLILLMFTLKLKFLADCALMILSFSAQLFFPAQQLRLANQFAARRTAILAWNNSALFLGISIGSLIGGQAVALGGFDIDLTIAAAIALAGSFSTLDRRRRSAEVRTVVTDQACVAKAS